MTEEHKHGETALQCRTCKTSLDLEKKKILMCSACRVVYYCGKDCQVSDWKDHKRTCKVKEEGSNDEVCEDIPKISIAKLVGYSDTDQTEEFQRLWNGLMKHTFVVLHDLPPHAATFYQEFNDQCVKNHTSGWYEKSKQRGGCSQTSEQESVIFKVDAVPHTMFSRRFSGFCVDFLTHVLDAFSYSTTGEGLSAVIQADKSMAVTFPLPRRTLRQSMHNDGGILSIVCPIVESTRTTLTTCSSKHDDAGDGTATASNEGDDAVLPPSPPQGLECYHPETGKFRSPRLAVGEMILMTGESMPAASLGWIKPCPHRVITNPNMFRQAFVVGGCYQGYPVNGRIERQLADLTGKRKVFALTSQPPWLNHVSLNGFGKHALYRTWLDPDCYDMGLAAGDTGHPL